MQTEPISKITNNVKKDKALVTWSNSQLKYLKVSTAKGKCRPHCVMQQSKSCFWKGSYGTLKLASALILLGWSELVLWLGFCVKDSIILSDFLSLEKLTGKGLECQLQPKAEQFEKLQFFWLIFLRSVWVGMERLTAKPYILQKISFQLFCCKCLAW